MNLFGNDPFPYLPSPHSQNTDEVNEPQKKPKCPAIFFFGAGASKPANVPTTVEFVDQFKKEIKEKELGYFEMITELIEKQQKRKLSIEKPIIDIEMILEVLDRIEKSNEDPLLSYLIPDTIYLKEISVISLNQKLKSFIKKKGMIKADAISYMSPLKDLITIFDSINIITTNYDIVIEQFCNSQNLSLEDGFGNIFEFERLKNSQSQIKLFKVHGSILWYRSKTGQFYKLPIKTDSDVETVFGEDLEPLIIYPMRKWQYIEPTFEIINEAKRIMRDPDIKFIYVFGYSFRDDHILDIFLDVFRDRRDLYCILVDPYAYKIYEDKLRYNDESKSSESSIAGRVICKPFTIQTELEYFFANSLNPLVGALNELIEFRHGTWNWSHPAFLLLENNYLSEFEKLRQNRGFLELEKPFWDKLQAVLLYIANQVSAEIFDKIFFSIDELLVLLNANFIEGLQFEPLVDGNEKRYKINVAFLEKQGRRIHDITSFELNDYKAKFIDYWEMLRTKFDISGVNKKRDDWKYEISYEILELGREIHHLFEEVSGSKYGADKPLAKSKIVEIMHGFLKGGKKEYNKPDIKNNPKELVPLYLNIVLKQFAENVRAILAGIKRNPQDGLKWFSNNGASSEE